MRRLALLLLLLWPWASATADEGRGIVLTRKAQAALSGGNADAAVELLTQARIEWPGAPEVAHTLGDAYATQGNHAAALGEYAKGAGGRLAFRAYFNQGVVRNDHAELGLAEAGVPLDPAGLPEDAPPQPLLEAIKTALPELERARTNFLDALVREPDHAARESVAAINERIDELLQMREELEQRLEDQQQEQQDQEDQDQQDKQDGDQQDQNQGDQPPDEGKDEQQQEPQPEDGQDEQDQSQDGQPPEGQPAASLTAEQVQQLMDQLEELEQRARMLQHQRRAAQRQGAEKDW